MSNKIVVYGKHNCKYCTLVKMFLESNGVEHQYLNIDDDAEAKEEFLKYEVMSVPITVANGEVLVGWTDEIREKLADFIE